MTKKCIAHWSPTGDPLSPHDVWFSIICSTIERTIDPTKIDDHNCFIGLSQCRTQLQQSIDSIYYGYRYYSISVRCDVRNNIVRCIFTHINGTINPISFDFIIQALVVNRDTTLNDLSW